ncbi:MAG: hypothetical protein VXZ29_02265, partial [Pseudomonadota bacterium]|nr:hypothetical protein [Pseudomonadota bacterium]
LAQRPKPTPSLPTALIYLAMPRELSLSWPTAAGHIIEQHTDAPATTSGFFRKLLPRPRSA